MKTELPNWKKFCEHIVATNGNPTLAEARNCHLEFAFYEICMSTLSKETLVKNAKNVLKHYN